MTMIERVAKKLQSMFPTLGLSDSEARAFARAVIETMREPTEAMTGAMQYPSNAACWRAAIDAALRDD